MTSGGSEADTEAGVGSHRCLINLGLSLICWFGLKPPAVCPIHRLHDPTSFGDSPNEKIRGINNPHHTTVETKNKKETMKKYKT